MFKNFCIRMRKWSYITNYNVGSSGTPSNRSFSIMSTQTLWLFTALESERLLKSIIINWTNLDVGEDAGRGVGYDHRHGVNGGVGLEVNQVQTLRDRDVRHLHNMSISNEDGNQTIIWNLSTKTPSPHNETHWIVCYVSIKIALENNIVMIQTNK